MLNTNSIWHILKKVVLRFKFTIFSALKAICQLKNKFPHAPRYMENPCCYGVPTKGSWYKQRKKQVYSKKVKMTLICRLAIFPKSLINTRKIIPQYGCFESCQFRPRSVFFVSSRLKQLADDFRCLRYDSIGKPRVSPLISLNTSAVIRYLICVYASHFFAGRPYLFNQTFRTTNKF
jgi:hypothetical protein